MLSPNDTNLVALIRGTGGRTTVTATVKLQESTRSFESVTVHPTDVGPAGKLEPLDGEQTTDRGVVPPTTVDEGYVTGTGRLVTVTATGAGQVIFGGSVGTTGVGDGDEPHPAATKTPSRTTGTHRGTMRLNGKAGSDHSVTGLTISPCWRGPAVVRRGVG